MRVRRCSPLLFLLLAAPSLSHALQIYSQERDSAAPNLRKREAAPEVLDSKAKGSSGQFVAAEPPSASAKPKEASSPDRAPYRGTEDAPVDGFDGKPHTGPFVYDKPDESDASKSSKSSKSSSDTSASGAKAARPADLDKWTQAGSEEWRVDRGGEIPEKNDGVMNDENRVAPKKGTDGTAGGISEKEKERKLKGAKGAENKPQEPKEAPPLPHSEEEWIQQEKEGKEKSSGSQSNERSGTRVPDTLKDEDKKFGAGGYGIDLPGNLPEKPHKIPHPDPGTGSSKGSEPPVDGESGGSWLLDTMPYTEGKKPKTSTPQTGGTSSPTPAGGDEEEAWHEWFHSFVLSFTMILFSEIGDKTFLVAALMAMRHPRILVFSAAFGALIVMTVLSAVLGHAFPALLPKRFTTFAAAVLFLVFGARSLKEGLEMPKDSGVGEEMREVEAELEEKEHSMARDRRRRSSAVNDSAYALEAGRGRQHSIKLPRPAEPSPPSSRSQSPSRNHQSSSLSKDGGYAGLMNLCSLMLSPAWVQTFVMTFLGEWGDRSQIATIAMAAGQDYWWVTLGAISGHAVCTGVAVVGGRALAGKVSMRVVTIGGAVAFLAFGVIYLFECLTEA